MIESMESRVLLSASVSVISGDLAAGSAALTTAKADLKSAVKTAAADIKAFKTDVKGEKLTAPQKSALSSLEKAEASDAAKLNSVIGKTLATGTVRGAQLEADLKSLSAHPTSAKIQAKVTAALTKLQGVFSTTVIATLENDASTAISVVDTDLTAVGTAIPSTAAAAATAESDLTKDLNTFSTDATSVENVITALATDLA
jgi:hypothetical protein